MIRSRGSHQGVPEIEQFLNVTGPLIGLVHISHIWPVDRPHQGHSWPQQGQLGTVLYRERQVRWFVGDRKGLQSAN